MATKTYYQEVEIDNVSSTEGLIKCLTGYHWASVEGCALTDFLRY